MSSNHIIIVAPYDLSKIGGVERFILSFAEAANKLSHRCVLYVPRGFNNPHVPCIDEIGDTEYDLCISHAIFGAGVLPRSRRKIHTFHGTILGNLFQRPWLWLHPKFLQWLAMESSSRRGKDGVVGVSDWAIKEIHRMGYRGPIAQIPSGGGFEVDRIKVPKKAAKNGELICVFCGRTDDKVKRFSMILDGFRLAYSKNQKLKLLVIGESTRKSEKGVEYLGNKSYPEVIQLMKSAHVQINASYYEGYSLSLSEGIFRAGLITIATPVGGNLNTVIHGKSGFFCNTPVEMATYLISLSKSITMQEKLFEYIIKQMPILSWEQVVRRTIDFAVSLPQNNDLK